MLFCKIDVVYNYHTGIQTIYLHHCMAGIQTKYATPGQAWVGQLVQIQLSLLYMFVQCVVLGYMNNLFCSSILFMSSVTTSVV